MDPIQMLTEDHEKVKGLFRQYEQATDAQQKQQLAQTVFTELQIHSALEKELFYPAVARKGDPDEQALVEHSYHDHAAVEQLIGELQGLRPTDPQYDAKFRERDRHVNRTESGYRRAEACLRPPADSYTAASPVAWRQVAKRVRMVS